MTETVQGTYLVDPATLRTLRRLCYADGIRGDITTAHPTLLPNGDLVNFLSTVRVVDWVSIGPTGRVPMADGRGPWGLGFGAPRAVGGWAGDGAKVLWLGGHEAVRRKVV